MSYPVKSEQRFNYCEQGEGEPIVLLHGLFGALSNFNDLIGYFSKKYKVLIPLLPLFELDTDKTTVNSLVDFIDEFIEHKNFTGVHLIGNSLGGHVAQLYILRKPEKVITLTLTGSSGLFENSLGDTYPRKGDLEYVKKKTEATFYNPGMASAELVNEVYGIVNDRNKAIRIVLLAKSALRHNLRDQVPQIRQPVCLIWGQNDSITPAFVGEEFNKLLPDSELHIVEKCGHAPMMEQPDTFNRILEQFLNRHNGNS